MSVPDLNKQEQEMNNGIQDYIIERLQEVQIAQNKERTYSQVV